MLKRHFLPIIMAALVLSACDSQLDLVPKGQTTLDKTSDLELLLNQEYSLEAFPYDDLNQICGESLAMSTSVAEVMGSPNSLKYAYMAFDESVDRPALAQEDARYSAIYKYINYCNTLLSKIDAASGMEERKPRLKAEARIMRAYFHWLAVNMYAAQYPGDAEAEKMGGIAYVTDIENMKVKEKLDLAQVYSLILDDCDETEVIALLPSAITDVCRPSQTFGYAFRGRVLMQMKKYEEALPLLEESIKLCNAIDDRAYIKDSGEWVLDRTDKTNLLYIGAGPRVNPTMEMLTRESDAKFDKNDYVIKYCGSSGWDYGYGKMYSGLDGVRMCMGWSVQGNPYGMTSVRTILATAECLMRTGDITKGLQYLDNVRKVHIENATPYSRIHQMIPFTEKAAVNILRQTKWIECLGSFENFFDMKRWNSEPEYARSLSKDLDSYGIFTIEPDSPLWILPFPANATRYNPTLTQNF